MQHKAISIRPFIGAKDFEVTSDFYKAMGFVSKEIFPDLTLFTFGAVSFYLQRAYVKDWVDNTQVFIEIEDLPSFWNTLKSLNLPEKFSGVRVEPIRHNTWGDECFVHDPSGILWHFGEFKNA